MCIVEWCNSNIGFIDAILSLSTIFVSIIAMIVSIQSARLPYKKKININVVFNEDKDLYTCKIYIINTGNRTIGINGIELSQNGKFLDFLDLGTAVDNFIEPGKVYEDAFLNFKMSAIDNKQKKIKVRIIDTEYKEYIFKVELAMG